LEVREEVLVRLHGDDPAFLRPDLLEQREQELAPLGRLGLAEACEVVEQLLRALDARIGRRAELLHLLLDRLAAHDVLRFGDVAEHVEVLQALELAEQFFAHGIRRVALGALGFDGLDDAVDQAPQGIDCGAS